MQLVAYGAQDAYLTGQPQITFFKVLYRRYTPFAMESVEQVFNGQADFGKRVTCPISRNGDLINKVYLRVVLPSVTVPNNVAFRWLDWVGQLLIKYVDLEIGGQRIDRHYGEWLHIWNELTQSPGKQLGYANMVGMVPYLTQPFTNTSGGPQVFAGETLYIPLEFWFCRNPGLALPLIALQYHEVRINCEFRNATDCYWAANINNGVFTTNPYAVAQPSMDSCSLYVDYVYLDIEERKRFAQVAHEYLIEQLQYPGDESASSTINKLKLCLNHPCKELVFTVQPDHFRDDAYTSAVYGKQWFNYTDALSYNYVLAGNLNGNQNAFGMSNTILERPSGDPYAGTMPGVAAGGAGAVYLPVSFENGTDPITQCKLQLNGHDRFSQREGRWFNLIEPYARHENVPSMGIHVYSFALRPEEHQPSGTCNFSRIDNATLSLTLTQNSVAGTTASIRVWTVNYNVLRITSGMGGLAYAN